jgi:putative intracellular protease/amidase
MQRSGTHEEASPGGAGVLLESPAEDGPWPEGASQDIRCPMLRRLERTGLRRDESGFVPQPRVFGAFREELGARPSFIAFFGVAPFSPSLTSTLANLLKRRVDFSRLGGNGFFNHRWRSDIFDRRGVFDPAAFARMASQSADGRTLTVREWSRGQRVSLGLERAAGENVPHDLLPAMYEGFFVAFDGALLFAALARKGADGVRRVDLDEVRAFFRDSRLPERYRSAKPRPSGITLHLDAAVACMELARGAIPAAAGTEIRGPIPEIDRLAECVTGALASTLMDRGLLRSALARLPAHAPEELVVSYRRLTGRTLAADLRYRLRGRHEVARMNAYLDGRAPESHALGFERAFARGDEAETLRLLDGQPRDFIEQVKAAYRGRFRRDLEYDMRGFSLHWAAFDPRAKPKLSAFRRRGLRGGALERAYRALHTPRLEWNAARIAELVARSESADHQGRREIYAMLALAGGEERTLLDEKVRALTGRALASVLGPVFRAHARENARRPVATPPERTAAIVVSSGNWSQMLAGTHRKHIGGYHWQEFYDEAAVALARGWSVEFFTPLGLPPSPDALSLLQTTLGPMVGFGLAAGMGPESPVGRRICAAFLEPRPLALEDGTFTFDASRFGTFHVAGGHGSPHDVVNNQAVERAAREMHEQGRIISAVCHATSALGPLLSGGNTTGFPNVVDQVMMRLGYVLDEFKPPFHTHKDLRERVGARVSAIRATLFPMHTEVYRPGSGRAEIHTGTGPIATAPMARKKYAAIAAREPSSR